MQHIEQAGVHSGDSACSIPPQTISEECLATIREWTPKLAKALKVVGLINIQYAVQDNQVGAVGAVAGVVWADAAPRWRRRRTQVAAPPRLIRALTHPPTTPPHPPPPGVHH